MTCLTAEKRGISGLAMKVREGQGVKVKGGVVHPGTELVLVMLGKDGLISLTTGSHGRLLDGAPAPANPS
ncbi:hypothetical protein QQP08_018920 [Theobroma cacao]|nr:hypothetical protein QQP08_018920 [Theobroma cacao]